MNQTIETIPSHRSIRRYSDRPVEDGQLDAILRAAQASPVPSTARRCPSSWCAAPVFLVFVMDFHKTAYAAG